MIYRRRRYAGMKENSFTINPEVNSAQEFIEISQDFSNSLDLVREAISNAFDAQAKNVVIYSSHYFSNYNWKKVVKLPVNTILKVECLP